MKLLVTALFVTALAGCAAQPKGRSCPSGGVAATSCPMHARGAPMAGCPHCPRAPMGGQGAAAPGAPAAPASGAPSAPAPEAAPAAAPPSSW
jgi:hypothetical protein